ncbi:hypothetical protein GWI33_000745 [Rhynchophorus ferrugineus]|uniref:Uncharacterized protein n=1 Tax=Rhynchophorus ferrugineus TaxID=354439 RepID=A0A834LYM6_RHYFE|nr:hypothetical protein GWI33_000745 [Rhynchophorus ferrugineus]
MFSVCIGSTKITYRKCNYDGFSCVTNANKKRNLIYTCTAQVNDILLYINMMGAPTDIDQVLVRNCQRVTLATRCSSESRFPSYLGIVNVKYLTLPRYQYEPMVPPTVHLENIGYIDVIPYHTFAQIEPAHYSAGCALSKSSFESLTMINVNIGEIQSGAIVATANFKNAVFVNVKIRRLQTSGVKLKMDLPGEFKFENSSIDYVEHLGFQLVNTRRAIFSGNNFTELSASAINGTIGDFYFVNNTIETTLACGFSLLATNVFIMNNTFIHMHSGALERISPGLIQDSGRNFGRLKFVYDFSKNVINFVDAAGLNPDYVSYENVQTEMVFRKNKLFCSCENIGWLFSELGYGPNSLQLRTFYGKVLDENNLNVCFHNCVIPLKTVQRLIVNGKCLRNITIDSICNTQVEIDTLTKESTEVDISTGSNAKRNDQINSIQSTTTDVPSTALSEAEAKCVSIILIVLIISILGLLNN